MTRSTWTRHLPPVVRTLAQDAALDLDDLLVAFETVLSGPSGTDRPSPGERIDRLHRLFDPWATDAGLLPWLAGWVSFELPPAWEDDEYQKRRAVAEIARVHAHRGRREGMARYLDLHSIAPLQPRITIDDGSRLLFARPAPADAVPIHSLLSTGPVLSESRVLLDGLVRPRCIALLPDRELDLVLGDLGGSAEAKGVPAGVWRVDRTGQPELAGVPPEPRRLGPPEWQPGANPSKAPIAPVAIAVDPGPPWIVYVLDETPDADEQGQLFRFREGQPTTVEPAATRVQLGVEHPVAMTRASSGRLHVLDRPEDGPPVLVEIDPSTVPPGRTTRALDTLVAPLSMLASATGSLIVGDAGEGASEEPASLFRIEPSTGAARSLLSDVAHDLNPLVAPTAVLEEDDTHLLVLDVGLKPLAAPLGDPFQRIVARPAAVYRVDLAAEPATVTLACRPGRLVHPTGMVRRDGTLYLCDPGEPETETRYRRPWRARDAEFGVLVHFGKNAAPGPNLTKEQREAAQRVVREGIERIVADQQPARALGSVVTAIESGVDDDEDSDPEE